MPHPSPRARERPRPKSTNGSEGKQGAGPAKVGRIPEHLAPILSRIGLDPPGWCDVVCKFGRVFKRAAGVTGLFDVAFLAELRL